MSESIPAKPSAVLRRGATGRSGGRVLGGLRGQPRLRVIMVDPLALAEVLAGG